ncbi:MAG: hypothetical protein ACRDHM_06610 [Actinomycetota bacterium]
MDDGRPVGVVGLGVVGGTIARAFAERGLDVRGYDRYLETGEPKDLAGCRVVFLCVPSPPSEDGRLDLSEVWSAVLEIEPHLDVGTVIAIKSTIRPGACDEFSAYFPRLQFASVPEFLVAARPMETFTQPDRILIGAYSPDVVREIAAVMSRVAPAAPILALSPREAELAKLCANVMLAAKVTMANQLSDVCSLFGVEWPAVQAAVGMDRRIGPDHLTVFPERGFGGSCLPKDVDGLIAASRAAGYSPPVLEAIAEFNRRIRLDAAASSNGSPPSAFSVAAVDALEAS